MKNRIKEIADFFYPSYNPNSMPLKISLMYGRHGKCDLTKKQFIKLMNIFNTSIDMRRDMDIFLNRAISIRGTGK
uniref:Uncharacterized protein n=1 Tax=viral metagenome TaxID=1070528 RepID=A0A6M3IDI5_9ZZZZ